MVIRRAGSRESAPSCAVLNHPSPNYLWSVHTSGAFYLDELFMVGCLVSRQESTHIPLATVYSCTSLLYSPMGLDKEQVPALSDQSCWSLIILSTVFLMNETPCLSLDFGSKLFPSFRSRAPLSNLLSTRCALYGWLWQLSPIYLLGNLSSPSVPIGQWDQTFLRPMTSPVMVPLNDSDPSMFS